MILRVSRTIVMCIVLHMLDITFLLYLLTKPFRLPYLKALCDNQ